MISTYAFFDEMNKLSAVTPEVARASMDRLKKLEESKPTTGQLGRGAMVGALAGPAASVLSKAIAGDLKKGFVTNARALAGASTTGAIYGGALPFARHKLEHASEKQKLKEYVGQHPRGRLRGEIRKTVGI